MITDPLHLGRSISRVLAFRPQRTSHAPSITARPSGLALRGETVCLRPTVPRHLDREISRCQQAFINAARRHEARAELLERRERSASAVRHRRMAMLLRAYAQPGEIERLPIVSRPGPVGTAIRPGVHPAMVLFLEGAAEEFLRLYDANLSAQDESELLASFRRANFHHIYIARLLEIDDLLRAGKACDVAEAVMARRYGPHAL